MNALVEGPARMAGRDSSLAIQEALLGIPYGVHIVTTGGASNTLGAFTASWLMQVSFDPLLVALAVDKMSHSQARLVENGAFAVNFLAQNQTPLAARLGTPYRINPYKFSGMAWHAGITGAPLLDEAVAYLECEVSNSLDPGGDHVIVVGKAVAGGMQRRQAFLTLEQSGLRYR
ncbi:MAG: flavin reductase family protein [Anaerolineales bacterium]